MFRLLLCSVLILSAAVVAAPKEAEEITIAILGDSSTPENDKQGFNSEVLALLLDNIKKRDVNAVFFTGNLTSSTVKKGDKSVYNSEFYGKQLLAFHALVKKMLGAIPFYPMVGEQDVMGPDALKLFRDQFNLGKAVTINDGALVYSVSIGNAYFIVLQTDFYDPKRESVVENEITNEWLDWLENDLKEKSYYYPYIFVLGHAPAFSPGAVAGTPDGLDKDVDKRDQFWAILKQYNVLGYFSGSENFFDRSLRRDVWQVISGGAGAPVKKSHRDKVFFHYLLLTIPQGKKGVPVVKVIDLKGGVKDSFEMTRTYPTIYELRISGEN